MFFGNTFVFIQFYGLEKRLATLSFYGYNIALTLLVRSCILCFETVLGVNKIIPTPTPLQKIKKTQKINFCLQ